MRKIYILIHDYRDFSPWTPGSIAKDPRKGKNQECMERIEWTGGIEEVRKWRSYP